MVNGLTDYNHPCQIMADILTVWEQRGNLDKYRYRFRSMSGQEFKRADNNMSQNYNLFTSAAFRNQIFKGAKLDLPFVWGRGQSENFQFVI